MAKQWQIIGEVCVDSGTIVICDPCRADEASDWWGDYMAQLVAQIKQGKADLNTSRDYSVEMRGENDFPLGVITETGIGDGTYKVEARYETDPAFGTRCAEIRIKFLPHPIFG